MKVELVISEEYYGAVKGMLNILLPQLEIGRRGEVKKPELKVKSQLNITEGIKVRTTLEGKKELKRQLEDKEILSTRYTEDDFKRRCKARIKLSIYETLCEYLDYPKSPWGILIGVRPTKIGHFLLDKGFSYQKIDQRLADVYGVKKEKRRLLLEVVKRERKYLPNKKEAAKKVSIYIGIPFCPTRCSYCSFASYPITDHGHYLSDFMEALSYEIEEIGKAVNKSNLQVDTVYFGGGTPTVLSSSQLDKILTAVKDNFSLEEVEEFTVEAGRPDTIDKEKLKVLKGAGVKRISINPQTMNQKTLNKIGRKHSVEEVKAAFKLARKIGFKNINMDLIVGLPEEKLADVEFTLEEVMKLAPDSLTVHTMTVKRASKLNKQAEQFKLPKAEEVKKSLQLVKETARSLELTPYYMYRQKGILANLENVGYAKPGLESIYNILMMEERETVIGLGGGAITKFVLPKDWSLEREVNPKFPEQYIDEVVTRTERKIAKLTSLLR